MFNVLNRSPPIPENLCSEGKDFLQLCFRRKPGDRPTASMLLDHPFLRNSHDQNAASCQQVVCGMKLSENVSYPHKISFWLIFSTLKSTQKIFFQGKHQIQRQGTKQNKELMKKGEFPYNRYGLTLCIFYDILQTTNQECIFLFLFVPVNSCNLIIKSQILDTHLPDTRLVQLLKFFLL